MKRILAAAALSAALLWGGLTAAAAPPSTRFTVTPDRATAQTGESITYTVAYTEGDMDVAGAMFTFTLPDGCTFASAAAGSGRSGNEISYSITGNELRLMFLDNGAGNTPVHVGEEISRFVLTLSSPGEKALRSAGNVDVSCIQNNTAYSVEGTALISGLSVQGETHAETPKAEPGKTVYAEAGGSETTVQTPAAAHSPAGPTPAPVKAPAANRPQSAEPASPAENSLQEAPHAAELPAMAPAEQSAGEIAPAPMPQEKPHSALPAVAALLAVAAGAGAFWYTRKKQ